MNKELLLENLLRKETLTHIEQYLAEKTPSYIEGLVGSATAMLLASIFQ